MFITFEGIEGCGKTTQVDLFVRYLEKRGVELIKTFEPGGTEIGKDIRKILLDSKNTHLSPLAELILYAADRAQHTNEKLIPALDRGKWVICDRFFDATVAYQGYGRGMDMELIGLLNSKAACGLCPDLTILLDCPEDIGLKRALARNKELDLEAQGRFEKEKLEFHRKVRNGYLALADRYKERFRVIDASRPVEMISQDIHNLITPYIDAIR
ncbi:MAG: dTMP kinase [Deltaproteobacteria bacterium]|nr:dTMP kinase [Deltaproteobacteria bacterium]